MRPGPHPKRGIGAVAALAVVSLGLASCSPSETDDTVVLDYWLWDANQLPAYELCVQAFEGQHEDIEVRIHQYGWDDYWQKVTASFVAGAGPDVITGHLTYYPEYERRGVLMDLSTLEATRDIAPEEFQEGLAELWQDPSGAQYGIPKDFDTVALFYNEDLLQEAGLTGQDLQGLDWNPDDGGTFEEVIARLSVDAEGVRGDEEGFDPDNVVTYGLASNGSGGFDGQTQWSWLAGATGWQYTNAETWGDQYNYDDPDLQDSIEWLFSLVDKGFMPPFEVAGTDPNPIQQFGSGQAAISANGSWMISSYSALDGVEMGIAPLPSGPVGHPVSMYNGLGDVISAQSENPEEAAELVAFFGSDACQVAVGEQAIVFPARPAGTEAAIEAFSEQGIDVTPFTDLVDEGNTMLFPVTYNVGAIDSMVTPLMDAIYIGSQDASALTEMNDRVNALFDDDEQ